MRCVVAASEDHTTITPCGGLEAATTNASSGPGARIETWMNFKTGARHDRLTIRPQKKEGGGVIANFCPFCGTVLTPEGNGFAAKEPGHD
jgi:hypothetical protein